MRLRPVLALLAVLVVVPARAQIGPDIVQMAPEEAFAAVERILLEEAHLGADEVTVRADSAVSLYVAGNFRFGPENRVRLRTDGLFTDFEANVSLRLVSDGARMAGGRSAEIGFDTTAAPALREALAVGFTRMGLLHNLVRLFSGAPPERSEGGVTDWVDVYDFAWLPENTRVNMRPARPLRFTIRLDGEDTAEAVLHLDVATGLPLLRQQTVHFAMGRMVVQEQYAGWTRQPPPEAAFAVEPGPFQ